MSDSHREDNIETQVRLNSSQMQNKNGADFELAEHLDAYDFLISETAYRLWGVICELQKEPNTTLTNASVTSCRCQLYDMTEEMVCL